VEVMLAKMFMHLKYVWGMSQTHAKGLVKDLKMAWQVALKIDTV
jgi:hypothetical protein